MAKFWRLHFNVTKDILIRLENEENLAKELVQQYHSSCSEILRDFDGNAMSRIKHNAKRLANNIKEFKMQLENTVKVVSPEPEKAGKQIDPVSSVSVQNVDESGRKLLELLDGVRY